MAQRFLENLGGWVKSQEAALNVFMKIDEHIRKGADRLELILAIREAFNHIEKTVKAFNNWLSDPLIIANLDEKNLLEVWDTVKDILIVLTELDIRHTSEFREQMYRNIKERNLSPLTRFIMEAAGMYQQEEKREKPSITI